MANLYVRSTDGSDADNGTTWALAKATLAGAAAIDAAGDTIYVSQAHAESTASAISLAFAGTVASPVKIICGSDAAEPPTAVSTAGTVTTTSASSISINGYVYVYGLTFNCASGSGSTASLNLGAASVFQYYENCSFKILTSSANGKIYLGDGSTYAYNFQWRNCSVSFASSGHAITVTGAAFLWEGGSAISGTSTPTTNGLINISGNRGNGTAYVSGVDLSNFSSSLNLVAFQSVSGKVVIRNCKLPASWSGSLVTGTIPNRCRAEMYNCDSADTNYRLLITDYVGSIQQETTIVRSGGASDGTTSISWKMVSGSDAEYPHQTLDTPEIVRWNETTGSSITVTVEVVTDNVTLTDAECWIDVQYLGTSGYPLGGRTSDAKADVLASAANHTSSSETWTTTGLTTPVKQKLSVTFTPQEKGFIHAVVKLAKASATVYVDPKLTVA